MDLIRFNVPISWNGPGRGGIDFEWLIKERERIKQTKSKEPKKILLGECDFLLHPFGTASGCPLVISNEDFKIEMGEFNNPNFFAYKRLGSWF
jgi:hypothetical protein